MLARIVLFFIGGYVLGLLWNALPFLFALFLSIIR